MSPVLQSARRLSVVASALLVAVFAAAPAVYAQDDAFKKGIDARNDKKWPEVVAQMQAAIKANPKDDGHKVRTGGVRFIGERTTEYFPHVYLAEALSKNPNTCVEAVETWSQLEQDGLLRGRADVGTIVAQGYAECEKAGVLPPAKFDPLYGRVKAQVDEASAMASKIVALGQNPEVWRGDAREQYRKAADDITNAQARLRAGKASRTEGNLTVAGTLADGAKRVLVTVESSLSAALTAQQRFAAQLRDAEQQVAGVEDQDREIDPRKGKLTASGAGTYREAHDIIGRARTRLNGAKTSLETAAVSEAVTLAKDASARFSRVMDELLKIDKEAQSRQLANAVSAAQEAFAFVDGAFVTLERLGEQKAAEMSADKVKERDAIKKDVEQARRRFEAARKIENVTNIVAVTRVTTKARDRLSELIATFGPVTLVDRGVNQALLDGANFYLAGEYDKALAALNPPGGFAEDVPLRPQIHLFRAAALYALFERSAQKDASLRARAVTEIEEYKQLSDVPPSARAFSPRFLNFVQGAGARAANAPAGPASQ